MEEETRGDDGSRTKREEIVMKDQTDKYKAALEIVTKVALNTCQDKVITKKKQRKFRNKTKKY